MTTKEVCERLAAEFPGRAVCFEIDCWSHRTGTLDATVTIYEAKIGHIECTDLDDGIEKLKRALCHPPSILCDIPESSPSVEPMQ